MLHWFFQANLPHRIAALFCIARSMRRPSAFCTCASLPTLSHSWNRNASRCLENMPRFAKVDLPLLLLSCYDSWLKSRPTASKRVCNQHNNCFIPLIGNTSQIAKALVKTHNGQAFDENTNGQSRGIHKFTIHFKINQD